MRFVTLSTGCFCCISHLPNKDGYLRKAWGNQRSDNRELEMFHRFIYRAHKGDIPAGHEVDHECGIRLCCNPDHLTALPRRDHLVKTNVHRYAARQAQAKAYWRAHPHTTGTELADKFGVSFGIGCRWIRKWRHL